MSKNEAEVIDLVQLALIAIEVGETVDAIAHRLGEAVVLDDIGLRSIPVDVARQFFAQRAEQKAQMQQRHAESVRRLKEAEAKRPRFQGIPAPAGAPLGSALEVMMAAESKDRDWLYGSGKFTR